MSKGMGDAKALQAGLSLHQRGDLAGASKIYRDIIKRDRRNASALHFLGAAEAALGRLDEALPLTRRSVEIEPGNALFCENYAMMLIQAKDHAAALAACELYLPRHPRSLRLAYAQGVSLFHLDRFEESVAAFDRALAINPNYVEAISEKGAALSRLFRLGEAIACFDRALALDPNKMDAARWRSLTLLAIGGRLDEALAACDAMIARHPRFAGGYTARATVLIEMRRFPEALDAIEAALALDPTLSDAYLSAARIFSDQRHDLAALEAYDEVLRLNPLADFVRIMRQHIKMRLCDWSGYEPEIAAIRSTLARWAPTSDVFAMLGLPFSIEECFAAARIVGPHRYGRTVNPLWRGEAYGHERLRVAYLSADFKEHPVARLVPGLLEQHDRQRFEVYGISLSADVASEPRERIKAACDHFITVNMLGDRQIAEMLRENEIDIAVDMMGHTGFSRSQVFSHRAAPVQAGFLGYPGTTGADVIDYIIADKTIIPEAHFPFYSEKVVHLPDSFFVTDDRMPVSERMPTRAEAGLPESGFVFCCFNQSFKITPDVFDLWMDLLRSVEGSVLWMSRQSEVSTANLRREAEQRGIHADRLVIAGRVESHADHLARYRLADLFVDTLPYNAHTTACDALWSGLPVITQEDGGFAGRVAASQLRAIGLPEMICASREDYRALAIRLARDPEALAAMRAKLSAHRKTFPLFDTSRYTRHLEKAFSTMVARAAAGESPEAFAVSALVT